MRPLRLELEGFASFKERTVIDFEGAELFALTGPTGAGKSSVLDAIVFSLYGSVPRYDRRAVMPVITQGKLEAKVRLDFTVGDEAYSIARRVRRSGSPTCSFEKDGQAVAAGARDVQPEIERVIGLNFDQFTRCVLLPQGAFARFLHDSGADRNELLRKLLSLEIYSQLRQSATNRATDLKGSLNRKQGELDGIGDYTSDGLKAAEERSSVLDTLFKKVGAEWKEIEELEGKRAVALNEASGASKDLDLLREIAVPSEVALISETIAKALASLATATQEVANASNRVSTTQKVMAKLPSIEALKGQIAAHERLKQAEDDLKTIEGEVKALTGARDAARTKEQAAKEHLAAASTRFEEIRTVHQGVTVAKRLTSGDMCPVCGGKFERCPTDAPEDFQAAQAETKSAEEEHGKLFKQCAEVEANLKARSELRAKKQEEVQGHREAVKALPGLHEVKASLTEAEKARDAYEVAQKALTAALASQVEREQTLENARSAAQDVEGQLARAKQKLVHLNPPRGESGDPAKAWNELLDWAKAAAKRAEEKTGAAQALAADLGTQRSRREQDLCEQAARLGVVPDDRSVRDCCMEALSAAKQFHNSYGVSLDRVNAIKEEMKVIGAKEGIYRKLSEHLKTNRFETWLLNRSFRELCELASVKLRELSTGQYSISVTDSNEFQIIDHANADERRSVKSLSGGETFLASLSLALALAEGVSSRSESGARLESLFLDEGFGTLDPETLETVAGAVEELGSKGRMIGVITHVRDFADRLPVRYEVRKDAGGSKVERVQA